MMEFSLDMPNLDQQFNALKRQNPQSTSCQMTLEDSDIIDLSQLNFNDDENWLLECSKKSTTDLHKWLHCPDDSDDLFPNDLNCEIKSDLQKNIDTRTFTRPKKRFTRPSIEKYNEELYGNDFSGNSIRPSSPKTSGLQMNGFVQDNCENIPTKPLHFDLAQPTSSYYFENILANAPPIDSFQNMSPPSLVNSMCSSTFANLMENSFIKNDPVLREIRDTDFTESILQQESEPMFQSITESCSSLNSDVPENFLKKVSFNESDKNSTLENSSLGNITICLNSTYDKKDAFDEKTLSLDSDHDNTNKDSGNLNGTYQEKTKYKGTFRMADVNNGTIKLNTTFDRRKSSFAPSNKQKSSENIAQDLNTTITLEPEQIKTRERQDEKTIENIKRLLDRRPSPSLDLNRLSYLVDDKSDNLNATFVNENSKRNSFGSSDSGENLDYMSLSSSSSKSSNKILSLDGINVIVEMQERSLQQIMSTPKPNNKTKILWENNVISPISGRNSDPELSSSEINSPKALVSPNAIKKQKSLGNIHPREQLQQKSINRVSKLQMASNIRGSYPSLKAAETKTRQSNLCRPTQGSRTNLNSMGHTLKGSYTSLKPMNPNLPVAPPPLDSTITLPKKSQMTQNVEGKVAQVSPIPREVAPKVQDAQFVKPQPPRTSGLPRPVTGIPRPVSRIPGPRTVRLIPKPAGQQGKQSNYH